MLSIQSQIAKFNNNKCAFRSFNSGFSLYNFDPQEKLELPKQDSLTQNKTPFFQPT